MHVVEHLTSCMMNDLPDLVHVSVVAPIGNSDHSSLLAVISMAQAVQTCVLVGKFSLSIKLIGIQFVVQCRICPEVTFGRLTILLMFSMSICCCWSDVLFQPRSSVCGTRISLGLMINTDMLLASSRRLIFGGPVIALWLTLKSLSAVKCELMKPNRRPSVSLVPETGMFL